MDFTELVEKLYTTSINHGFSETDNIERKLLLAVGELVEAQNELRDGHTIQEVYFSEGGKPEGFGIELADTVIRCLNLMRGNGLDPLKLILQKHEYNDNRPFMHGKKF
jgi:hypothetical protein